MHPGGTPLQCCWTSGELISLGRGLQDTSLPPSRHTSVCPLQTTSGTRGAGRSRAPRNCACSFLDLGGWSRWALACGLPWSSLQQEPIRLPRWKKEPVKVEHWSKICKWCWGGRELARPLRVWGALLDEKEGTVRRKVSSGGTRHRRTSCFLSPRGHGAPAHQKQRGLRSRSTGAANSGSPKSRGREWSKGPFHGGFGTLCLWSPAPGWD